MKDGIVEHNFELPKDHHERKPKRRSIKNGKSRETGNKAHKTQNEGKQNTKTQYRKLKG